MRKRSHQHILLNLFLFGLFFLSCPIVLSPHLPYKRHSMDVSTSNKKKSLTHCVQKMATIIAPLTVAILPSAPSNTASQDYIGFDSGFTVSSILSSSHYGESLPLRPKTSHEFPYQVYENLDALRNRYRNGSAYRRPSSWEKNTEGIWVPTGGSTSSLSTSASSSTDSLFSPVTKSRLPYRFWTK